MPEINEIVDISKKINFTLEKKIISHRKTSFGQRYILYFKKQKGINLHIITGLTGSGKTIYCNNLKNATVLTFDKLFDYSSKNIDYNKMNNIISTNSNNNDVYMDAYIFDIDPDLSSLINNINKQKSNKKYS